MTKQTLPRITQVYLCDNAFQDTRNKWNLIGIFTGDVVVEKFPARLRAALYVEIELQESIGVVLELFLGRKLVATINATVESLDGVESGLGVLAIPGMEFGVDKTSEFRVVGRIDQLPKRTVFKRKILSRPDVASSPTLSGGLPSDL